MKDRILVAGIGNIFLGDDAFGVEVIQRLSGKLPDSVHVEDFGIRGYDLAYALTDGYEVCILVDAMPRGGAPGTLYTMEPDLRALKASSVESFQAHGLDPIKVLSLARAMGGDCGRVLVVGCEPATLGDVDAGFMGLSAEVEAAAGEAVNVIESLVADLLNKMTAEADISEIPRNVAAQKLETGERI